MRLAQTEENLRGSSLMADESIEGNTYSANRFGTSNIN